MALKIRVMASHGRSAGRGPVPPLIYRAEAYQESDHFRDKIWGCAHDHSSVEGALHCGEEWLAQQSDSPGRVSESA